MTPTCILINGPKRVGKDTAALAIAGPRENYVIEPVMRQAKRLALTEIGLEHLLDVFELCKDTPFAELSGKTPRQVYIDFGNRKRAFDPAAIVRLWEKQLIRTLETGPTTIIVPDVRFIEEFYVALPIFKPANVLLMRIYETADERWQDGLPFQGDIGSYFVASPALWGHEERTLINDRPIEYYRGEAAMVGNGFIARRRIANSR